MPQSYLISVKFDNKAVPTTRAPPHGHRRATEENTIVTTIIIIMFNHIGLLDLQIEAALLFLWQYWNCEGAFVLDPQVVIIAFAPFVSTGGQPEPALFAPRLAP